MGGVVVVQISKQRQRAMLPPESHKLCCSVPKDKHFKVKGKSAFFLSFAPAGFKVPEPSNESWVGYEEERWSKEHER